MVSASVILHGLLALFAFLTAPTDGAIPKDILKKINRVNRNGPYLGLVIPNAFELAPLLRSSRFVPSKDLPDLDFAGRRFRFGSVKRKKVIVVMTGLGMVNAGLSTQLLLSLFDIEGVLHPGVAGNADPSLQIGDVTIPKYWAHLGLWYWQRDGDDENDELSLEVFGDYTREIGYLKFSDYTAGLVMPTERDIQISTTNQLNRVWYQPDEVFPVTGVAEERQHAFWIPTDPKYLRIAKGIKGVGLETCVNATTCLKRSPKVAVVDKGCSASTFVDNAAYRTFIRAKFNVTPVDMETAGVAVVCLQQSVPFMAFRSLSDLAGGGDEQSNEAGVFAALAANNAAAAMVEFISLLP